jgi:hypothetical protein
VYNEKLKKLVLHNLVEAHGIVLSDQCMGTKLNHNLLTIGETVNIDVS